MVLRSYNKTSRQDLLNELQENITLMKELRRELKDILLSISLKINQLETKKE